jgi:NhaA family Na+:H+ antiporter
MATDIAFCVGALALLRQRVPRGLVVFITALAIFDDIGGILVIAIFYGQGLSLPWLAAAVAVGVVLALLSRAYVGSAWPYLAAGLALWYALHGAGIHPTIAGVAVGLAVPAQPRPGTAGAAPLQRFERRLHPWVAFGVMPLFALANSGIDLGALSAEQLGGRVAVGVALGLVAGKITGIFGFTLGAVRAGVAASPGGAGPAKLLGVSAMAGIGFTVALFIANLAFPGHPELLEEAKVGIVAGSLVAGLAGAVVLRATGVVPEA